MIKIRVSDGLRQEREYIIDIIFKFFWNIDYEIVYENRDDICLNINDKSIIIDDSFFKKATNNWLSNGSMPSLPLDNWQITDNSLGERLVKASIPIIYGRKLDNGSYIDYCGNNVYIGIDIIGSAFFMLTRYEEVVNKNRDCYDRFSAYDSVAYKENFLERPIINEYLEILWYAIQKIAPEVKRKKRMFQIIPTHDVDRPFEFLDLSVYQVVYSLLGDLLKRRNIQLFFDRLSVFIKFKMGDYKADYNYTFNKIMDISEANGLKSTFFFMTANNISAFDGNYSIVHPYIANLMKDICKRGHKIGLHPSFESFKNYSVMENNKKLLDFGIKNNLNREFKFGARQHYLRWSCPETWQYYEDVGLTFDTTLSYADHIGFRCGICYEYPVFNLLTGKQLKLIEYPLIVMEGSGLDWNYMNLNCTDMLNRCIELKSKCMKFYGNFVILWHNTRFKNIYEKNIYKKIIAEDYINNI